MIGLGHENTRFAQAMQDEILRARLMIEYARKSHACVWAAVLQAVIALVLFLIPVTRGAHFVFLFVGLAFLVISVRLRRDLNRLRLADRLAKLQPGPEQVTQ